MGLFCYYYLAEVPAQSTEGACEVCHEFPKVNFSKTTAYSTARYMTYRGCKKTKNSQKTNCTNSQNSVCHKFSKGSALVPLLYQSQYNKM
jgi:hypothetical protein